VANRATSPTSSAITTREDEPHAGHGHEELNLRGHLEHDPHPLLEPAHAAVQLLDLLEELLGGVRRMRREEGELLPKEVAALRAEEITDLQVVERNPDRRQRAVAL
jgi:hypothetical protein